MRFTLVLSLLLLSASACAQREGDDDDDDDDEMRSSVIVFGITQRNDASTGRTVTTAGHEYLSLGAKTVTYGPWAKQRQSLPDGFCRSLTTTVDATRPNVGDGGRARFAGSAIRAEGIVVDANEGDPTYDGAAFDGTHATRFAVEEGFAIPSFAPIDLPSPNTALVVTTPSRDQVEVTVDAQRDFLVEWPSREDPDGKVMVTFAPDRGDEVQCFFREGDGHGIVKAADLRGLTNGTLTIASHRHAIVTPGDAWLVEVVGTAVVSEHRFVVR